MKFPKDYSLKVVEHYRCFQGEGISVGSLVEMIRLHGCNLNCNWCDSKFANKGEYEVWDVDKIKSLPLDRHYLISGGEPLIQNIIPLVDYLHDQGCKVEVETNGTIIPAWWWLVDLWNVSLKLSNSGVKEDDRLRPEVIKSFVKYGSVISLVQFKFVVENEFDLQEVREIVDKYNIHDEKVVVMPMGVTEESQLTIAREIEEAVMEEGWKLILRQHVLMWGNERGK